MRGTIILLHGALGNKTQLYKLAEILIQDFKVFTLDFEGHGDRPTTQPFSMALFSQNVLDFMEMNSIESTNLFGYSMGGYVALHFAKNHKSRVQKIITLGTKWDWTVGFAAQEVRKLHPEKMLEKVPKFVSALEKAHSGNDWKEVVQRTAQLMTDLGNGSRLKDHDFTQIHQEVLMLLGDQDNMVTYKESEDISRLLPNGKLHVLKDTPHMIENLELGAIKQAIDDFLS